MVSATGQNDAQPQRPGKSPPKRRFKPKAKTGCYTCRVRRIKCDEARPACKRCTSTDRVCDGYPSIFQIVEVGPQPTNPAAAATASGSPLSVYRPSASIVSEDEVHKLARHFTIKHGTVTGGYVAESRATLAKLSDPSIRHAIISLWALHDGFEARQSSPEINGNNELMRTHRGLDAYGTAVKSLAYRLAGEPSSEAVHAALLCCQLFISIETTLGDYAAGMRHFLYGLRIMYQYRSRPAVSDDGRILPSSNAALPSLDAFVIKLFASAHPKSKHMAKCQRADASSIRTVATPLFCHQARTELAELSEQVLEFLNKLSNLRNELQIVALQTSKAQILYKLQYWKETYFHELQQRVDINVLTPLVFGVVFSLLLHTVLKVVMSLALSGSATEMDKLKADVVILIQVSEAATEVKKLAMQQTCTRG